MRLQLTLALRYLTGRPLRTTLTTLAVVLGVALFFGLSSFVPVFSQAIQRGALAAVGEADLTVTHASSGVFGLDRLAVVRAVPGVGVASPSLRREVVLPAGAGVNALTVVGLDPATALAIRDYPLAAGRFLEVGDASPARGRSGDRPAQRGGLGAGAERGRYAHPACGRGQRPV